MSTNKIFCTSIETDLNVKERIDEDDHTDSKIIEKPKYLVGSFDIWCLGVTTVIGGLFHGWNTNLNVGFGSYFIAVFFMGTAYILLILAIAEIGSAFYFSGGCYGLTRVVLGFYPGFIVGYLQLVEFIIYASSSMIYVSSVICDISGINPYYQPLFWFICYAISLKFSMNQGKTMWIFINSLGIMSLFLLLLYCFGSLKWVNLSKYGPYNDNKTHDVWFNGGISSFLTSLATGSTVGFRGIESLALVVTYMKDPKVSFQYGAIISVITLFLCNIFILIVMSGLPYGLEYTSEQKYPMNMGYNLIFQWSSKISSLFVIPTTFAMGYGFFLPYGKLLQCLVDSHLAPEFLQLNNETNPKKAIFVSSIIGFLICFIKLIYSNISEQLNNIAVLCGFITYFAILLGHIIIILKHNGIQRSFKSPLNIYGSIYAIIIFFIGTIGSIGFLKDNHITIIIICIIIIFLTIYYYLYIIKSQILSDEENIHLFKLHVINFNDKRNSFKMKSRKSLLGEIGQSSRDLLRSTSFKSSPKSNIIQVMPRKDLVRSSSSSGGSTLRITTKGITRNYSTSQINNQIYSL